MAKYRPVTDSFNNRCSLLHLVYFSFYHSARLRMGGRTSIYWMLIGGAFLLQAPFRTVYINTLHLSSLSLSLSLSLSHALYTLTTHARAHARIHINITQIHTQLLGHTSQPSTSPDPGSRPGCTLRAAGNEFFITSMRMCNWITSSMNWITSILT